MPRVELDVEDIVRSGLDPTYTAAEADGNNWKNPDSRTFCHIKNGSGASITATIDATKTVSGLNVTDLTVAVPAGGERIIGPFPRETFNQGDRTVHIDYSAATSVTVGVFRLS